VLPVRILIVDDNAEFVEATRLILQNEFDVVGALTNGALVLPTVAELRPDVVVLDLSLGDTTGFEVARQLRSAGSLAKIVFLTIHEGLDFVRAAERLGVSGYVYKSQASNELPNAITQVYRGMTYFPRDTQSSVSRE
jgi:DNA-binding NarL/FixJ family response regulator